jgi:hypothetical protein
MICPDEGFIQSYLDKEMPEEEIREFDDHLSECSRCRAEVERHANNLKLLKKEFTRLDPDKVEVPDFPFSGLNEPDRRKINIKPMMKFFIPAAAALLIIILVVSNTLFKDEVDHKFLEAVMMAEEDILIPDSNSWWTEKRMFIAIIDEETKTMEKIVTSKKSENIIAETIDY